MEIVVSPLGHRNHLSIDILWFEFTDGSDNPKGKVYRLSMNYTEVGSDPSMAIKVSTRVCGDVIVTTITKILSFYSVFGLKIIFFDELIKMISKVLYILNHKSKSKVRCKNIEDYQWIKFQIHGPNIQPCHCVLGLVEKDRVVTVTPNSPESETHVNNQRISQTTTLQNGMTVRFGKLHVFRFIDPNFEEVSKNLISIFID